MVTLFTSNRHESRYHPEVSLNQVRLKLDKCPKILGVIFDTHFSFAKHVEAILAKAKKRLQLLKALAGTNWGHSKETLLATYKAILQPLFTFAAPIWYPNTHSSHIDKLQRIQTAAMRILTGNHGIVTVSHLQWETKLLPIDLHLRMLCQQFTASALRPHHPSHDLITAPLHRPREGTHQELLDPPETLCSAYLDSVSPFLDNGVMTEPAYKAALKGLHSRGVLQTRL